MCGWCLGSPEIPKKHQIRRLAFKLQAVAVKHSPQWRTIGWSGHPMPNLLFVWLLLTPQSRAPEESENGSGCQLWGHKKKLILLTESFMNESWNQKKLSLIFNKWKCGSATKEIQEIFLFLCRKSFESRASEANIFDKRKKDLEKSEREEEAIE